jgi:hypothetical protein
MWGNGLNDLNLQCGGEGFKSSHSQIGCTRLLGCLTLLGLGSYHGFNFCIGWLRYITLVIESRVPKLNQAHGNTTLNHVCTCTNYLYNWLNH